MKGLTGLLLAAGLLLSGCTGPTGDAPTTGSGTTSTGAPPGTDYPGAPTGSETLDIVGIVHDAALVPLAGAKVVVVELGLEARTNGNGQFAFPPVQPAVYSVRAEAPGFKPASATARPAGGALEFILQSSGPTKPYNQTIPFHGYLECASESLIITGPCDTVLHYAGQDGVFQNQSAFKFATDPNWATLVFDVDFDPDQAPGLDGLRLTVRGQGDGESLNSYEQYGRFHGSEPFSFRMVPGGNYTDGVGPVPGNSTVFSVDIYPQGKAYHEACDPTGREGCFLGVGAATNIKFDVYVTLFYLAPAPEGFTLL